MNRTLGSTLIVAGTTIGAGMLAMPLTSAGIGFGFTVFLLVILWALLTFSALLFVELYQNTRVDVGIASLAEKFFGKSGRIFSTAILLIFMYALVSAYITGGSGILTGFLPIENSRSTSQIAGVLFTLIFGSFVFFGTSSVDKINRLIFMAKLVFFALVLLLLIPDVSVQNLMQMPIDNALLISATPIFFTAFGFHSAIPSLNKYLDGNIKALRVSIIAGTLIPLVSYILWQFAIHGVLSQSEFLSVLKQDPTLNGLITATVQSTGSTILGTVVRVFSALALITSFLGVVLGLFEALEDLFKRINLPTTRKVIALATFLPPLVFALFYPQGFILALGYAGQMFVCYAIVLPIAMVWKLRQSEPNLPYRVKGGNIALVLTFILGVAIIFIPFLTQAGLLPSVVG